MLPPRCLPVLLALVLSATSACVSYPPDSPPPGYDQASPRRCVDYLKWAYENESPLHVSRCLSLGFLEGAGISPTDIATNWDSARDFVEKDMGDVQSIELEDVLEEDPAGRWQIVLATSRNRTATVTFVLESRWKIIPKKLTRDSAEGDFKSMSDILSYEGNTAVIRLPAIPQPDDYPPEQIHRILIDSSWRIDAIESDFMDEDGRKVRRRLGNPTSPARDQKDQQP